jgi:non-specific serine/threonine protein kinase
VRLTPSTRIGSYEILAPLGAGGMGEVYAARDSRLDRRVALKLVSSSLSGDAQALRSFRREAIALAALNHPNIAIVHDVEQLADGTAVLVMELVEGETLAARLSQRRMSVEESLQIGAQIAEALEVAHEHGIVHRDVKPGNVMIGVRGLVKVLDFGLALRAGDASPLITEGTEAPRAEADVATMAIRNETDSLAGMTVGSPGYMSPEQIRAEPADARSDIFAFGCVLYECLAGQRAFAGETAAEILRHTLSGTSNLDLLPGSLPGRIRSLIARSLEKDPAARPATMRAVRLEIEEALGIRRAAALREGSAYVTPNNLSPDPTSFVGREGVIAECERLLEQTRLLTVVGMGGAGKTRVALQLAQRALAHHLDGAWFVNLAAVTDNAMVPDMAAAALGVQDEPGRSSLEALVQHVGNRRMLFVLDNCEQVLPGVRTLVSAIHSRCPGSRVIATSREPLETPGEAVFVLPTLALPGKEAVGIADLLHVESVRLFAERARAAQAEFALTQDNAADVVEICRRLDGIPLALELAAARVRLLGVAQIRARLADRFRLLARPGSDASARQQTVLATIQWSWDHLLAPEQDLLRRLAVFMGGWTLERAAAVVSDRGDEFEVLDLLTRLVERSLVVVDREDSGHSRYRLLESVHQFALEKLRDHPDDARMRDRHLDAYLAFAELAEAAMSGAGLLQQIGEIKQEEENVLAALAWCRRIPNGSRRELQLAERFCRLWTITGRFGLGRRVLEEAIEHDAVNPPNEDRAYALSRLSGFTLNLGDIEKARLDLEESLAYWRSSANPRGLPATLGGLGVIAIAQNRFEDAFRLAEEALALYEQRGQIRGVAMALHNLGTIEYALARPDHGRAHIEQALALFREIGDETTEALCLSALTTACLRCGDREAARPAVRSCFDRLAQLDPARESVFGLEALADLMQADDRPGDAALMLGAARAGRATLQLPPMPHEKIELEELSATLEAALGAEEWERALAAGRTLSLRAAIGEGRRMLG